MLLRVRQRRASRVNGRRSEVRQNAVASFQRCTLPYLYPLSRGQVIPRMGNQGRKASRLMQWGVARLIEFFAYRTRKSISRHESRRCALVESIQCLAGRPEECVASLAWNAEL